MQVLKEGIPDSLLLRKLPSVISPGGSSSLLGSSRGEAGLVPGLMLEGVCDDLRRVIVGLRRLLPPLLFATNPAFLRRVPRTGSVGVVDTVGVVEPVGSAVEEVFGELPSGDPGGDGAILAVFL